jgi:hypothetical protein
MQGLSWFWIGLQVAIPPVLALLVAIPFWRKGQMIFGTVVGTGVICAAAIGLILREHVELDAAIAACFDEGNPCFPHPSDFTRFALYAFVAIFEVFGLFLVSLAVEERVRRRDYAPEWR